MKLYPIVLAAGFSSRFGSNKLLHPVEGLPMYRHIVDVLLDICGEDGGIAAPVVVTQYREIVSELEGKPLSVVWNPDSREGISSSVKAGLREVLKRNKGDGEEWGCCFFVADQPYLLRDTVRRFFSKFPLCGKGIGCLCYGAVRGNPAAFRARYVPELMELEGDGGGKQVIRRHPEDLWCMEASEKWELQDIDRQSL